MDEKLALEELQFIKKVIEDTKHSVVYNGKDYIFWGALVIVGMMLSYFLFVFNVHFNSGYIWLVLIPLGWAYSFYNKKRNREKSATTFSTKLIGMVWGTIGASMTIVGFLGPIVGGLNPIYISPLLSIMMGSGYFITGQILDSKWTTYLSIGWWIGGIILFRIHDINQFLAMSIMMLFFQTLPGIIVYRKYKLMELKRK
jgi:hypothetical protein